MSNSIAVKVYFVDGIDELVLKSMTEFFNEYYAAEPGDFLAMDNAFVFQFHTQMKEFPNQFHDVSKMIYELEEVNASGGPVFGHLISSIRVYAL